jgi:hypothetical protein
MLTASKNLILARNHPTSSSSFLLKPVGNEFRVRVDVDLAQWGFSNVRETVRRACRDRDYVSGADLKFFVVNRAPSPAFLHNDDLVIIMRMEWNLAARRCVDKKDRVRHAMLLADEFVCDITERQTVAIDDIGDRGWSHKLNEK